MLANATLNMKCYSWKDVSDFVLKEQIILAITGVIFFLLSLYLARWKITKNGQTHLFHLQDNLNHLLWIICQIDFYDTRSVVKRLNYYALSNKNSALKIEVIIDEKTHPLCKSNATQVVCDNKLPGNGENCDGQVHWQKPTRMDY